MPYLFSQTSKIRIYDLKFSNCSDVHILLWLLIYVINSVIDMCSMVHLVCLFMKMHLLALLQDNCHDLLRCAFLCKLSSCVTNTKAFCQHLLRLIKSAILADTDISAKPKYRPGQYNSLSPIFMSLCKLLNSPTGRLC